MTLGYFGPDVTASFGDLRLNSGRMIRLVVRPDPFYRNSVLYLAAFCNRPEGASDVISGKFLRRIVFKMCLKSRVHCLNCSREIPPDMTPPAASGRRLSRFEKRQKLPHPTALFALGIM